MRSQKAVFALVAAGTVTIGLVACSGEEEATSSDTSAATPGAEAAGDDGDVAAPDVQAPVTTEVDSPEPEDPEDSVAAEQQARFESLSAPMTTVCEALESIEDEESCEAACAQIEAVAPQFAAMTDAPDVSEEHRKQLAALQLRISKAVAALADRPDLLAQIQKSMAKLNANKDN